MVVDLLVGSRRCEVAVASAGRFLGRFLDGVFFNRKGGDFVVGTRADAGQLEYVLYRLALPLVGMATLRNFGVVGFFQEGSRAVVVAAICDPDVDDGKLRVVHALRGEFNFDLRLALDVFFLQTLCLSEISGMVLGEDARDRGTEGVLDLEFDVGCVLEGDGNRWSGVHRFAIDIDQYRIGGGAWSWCITRRISWIYWRFRDNFC